jgi:NADP-reducing hydrogenase subunit HndB
MKDVAYIQLIFVADFDLDSNQSNPMEEPMKSLEELKKIKEEVQRSMKARAGGQSKKVIVCMGTCGIAAGARETMKSFLDEIEKSGISDVAVTAAGCEGFCEREPLVKVQIAGSPEVRYGRVDATAAKRIVKDHLVGGAVVQDFVFS